MTATAISINEGEQAMNTIHHTDSSIEPTNATVTTDGEPVAVLDETPRGPVWRVVGGSLAAGLVGAIVLTLGVFGGAAEHVSQCLPRTSSDLTHHDTNRRHQPTRGTS